MDDKKIVNATLKNGTKVPVGHNKPVKMTYIDGLELAMDRCPHCQCPRLLDYKCLGCEAKGYREAKKEIEEKMSSLKQALMKWER